MKNIGVFIIFGIFCQTLSTKGENLASAVQIVSITNHTFNLESEELNKIVSNEYLKDRHVVAVSIAGAFRQGKSFLMNFFIKYLNAEVLIFALVYEIIFINL